MARVPGASVTSHRQRTTERIFEAFSELIYTQGYDLISLADVAAEAGLSRTAIYNYFPDKESLLVSYVVSETATYVAQLHEALREVDNPVDQLETFIRMQMDYFADHHLPPGTALQYLLPNEAHQQIIEHVSALDRTLDQILRTGMAQDYFTIDDSATARPLINACVSRERTAGADAASAADSTVTFVLRALGVPSSTTPPS